MKYLRYEYLQKYVKDEPRDEYMKGNLVSIADTSDGCERYDRHVAEDNEWIVYKNSNLVTGDSMFASHFTVTAEDNDYIYLRNTSPITEDYIGTQYSGGANAKPFGRVYKAGSLTVNSSQLSGILFDSELRHARLDLWDFKSQPVLKWTLRDTYAMTDPVKFLVGIECLGAKTPVDPAQFFSNAMSNVGDTSGARTLNLSAWADKLVVTDVEQMFQLQVSLGYIDIRGWDLSNATSIERMFWQAGTYLQGIDMSGVKMSSSIPPYSSSNKSTVFSYCQNLKRIYFSDQTSDDYDDNTYQLILSALRNPSTSYTRPTGYTVYRDGTVPSWSTTVECHFAGSVPLVFKRVPDEWKGYWVTKSSNPPVISNSDTSQPTIVGTDSQGNTLWSVPFVTYGSIQKTWDEEAGMACNHDLLFAGGSTTYGFYDNNTCSFSGCDQLVAVDFSDATFEKTGIAINIVRMFDGCKRLLWIDFDDILYNYTVIFSYGCFWECQHLRYIYGTFAASFGFDGGNTLDDPERRENTPLYTNITFNVLDTVNWGDKLQPAASYSIQTFINDWEDRFFVIRHREVRKGYDPYGNDEYKLLSVGQKMIKYVEEGSLTQTQKAWVFKNGVNMEAVRNQFDVLPIGDVYEYYIEDSNNYVYCGLMNDVPSTSLAPFVAGYISIYGEGKILINLLNYYIDEDTAADVGNGFDLSKVYINNLQMCLFDENANVQWAVDMSKFEFFSPTSGHLYIDNYGSTTWRINNIDLRGLVAPYCNQFSVTISNLNDPQKNSYVNLEGVTLHCENFSLRENVRGSVTDIYMDNADIEMSGSWTALNLFNGCRNTVPVTIHMRNVNSDFVQKCQTFIDTYGSNGAGVTIIT